MRGGNDEPSLRMQASVCAKQAMRIQHGKQASLQSEVRLCASHGKVSAAQTSSSNSRRLRGRTDSQIGAKGDNIFFVHLVLRPSVELCFGFDHHRIRL